VLFRELRSGGAWVFVLDVHPRVTVVTGLGEHRQGSLAAVIEGVLRGRPVSGGAGVAVDVDADIDVGGRVVGVREWAELTRGALDEVELLVRAVDIPHERLPAEGASVRDADEALAAASMALAEATAEVDAAHAELSDAIVQRERAERAVDEPIAIVATGDRSREAHERLSMVEARVLAATARVAEARAELEAFGPEAAGTEAVGTEAVGTEGVDAEGVDASSGASSSPGREVEAFDARRRAGVASPTGTTGPGCNRPEGHGR
jgi:hypothetical protein